ncbi:tRNA isopentenyl-2-thiomethyl-A-37 hydroxylase MiaE, partial [Pseudomonas aeruginosa]|nr:tRNA-(ms[2]io[6]A)-hydroxylase [Pseudomonas aeruginosa]
GDEADVERTIEVVRAKEAELISSPDNEFRFHSGLPVDLVA